MSATGPGRSMPPRRDNLSARPCMQGIEPELPLGFSAFPQAGKQDKQGLAVILGKVRAPLKPQLNGPHF